MERSLLRLHRRLLIPVPRLGVHGRLDGPILLLSNGEAHGGGRRGRAPLLLFVDEFLLRIVGQVSVLKRGEGGGGERVCSWLLREEERRGSLGWWLGFGQRGLEAKVEILERESEKCFLAVL